MFKDDEQTVEPASGNSGKDKGGKSRQLDKSRKRGFHHGCDGANRQKAGAAEAL